MTSPEGLVAKLAAIMAQVDRVPKRGWNDYWKFHYALETDVVDAVRVALAERGVMLLLSVLDVKQTEVPAPKIDRPAELFTTLTVNATWTDGHENLQSTWVGTAIDARDKGIYKAYTNTEKYILLKTFLMPTGDDVEAGDKAPVITAPPKAPRSRPARQEPSASPTMPQDGRSMGGLQGSLYLAAVYPGRGGAKAELVLRTGETLRVYKEELANTARVAIRDNRPVALERKQSKTGHDYVVNLSILPPVSLAEPPATAEDIPF